MITNIPSKNRSQGRKHLPDIKSRQNSKGLKINVQGWENGRKGTFPLCCGGNLATDKLHIPPIGYAVMAEWQNHPLALRYLSACCLMLTGFTPHKTHLSAASSASMHSH